MKFVKIDSGYIIRLLKEEDMVATLSQFCENENVHTGFFHGIGAVENVELGFYHLERREYEWKNFENPLEIVSLTGNVTLVDDKPFLHIHTVLSDSNFQTYGGHLKEAVVGATCEIYLTKLDTPLSRIYDKITGLKLLSLE